MTSILKLIRWRLSCHCSVSTRASAPKGRLAARSQTSSKPNGVVAYPGDTVERRHIGIDVLPADAWAHAVAGYSVPAESRSAEQQAAVVLSAALVDELIAADAVLLAVPLYNFGVSQHIKTWIDLVIADPRAGAGSSPLLQGKPVVLCTVRGGAYGAGTPERAGTTRRATCGASCRTSGAQISQSSSGSSRWSASIPRWTTSRTWRLTCT